MISSLTVDSQERSTVDKTSEPVPQVKLTGSEKVSKVLGLDAK